MQPTPPAIVMEAPAPPVQAIALDLPGALARARAANPGLKAAHARVLERQGLITSTKADAFPQVNVTGDFTRIRDVSLLTSSIAPLASEFFPGLTLDDLVGTRNIFTTQASLTQPLYYWGKIGTAIEVAHMGETEARYGFTTAELDVLHGVAKAYLAVLAARADLEVVEARQATAERFVADVKARLEAQTATELDRLRAESERLAVIPETLQARSAYERAVEVLNGQLGLDPRTPLQAADVGIPDAGALPPETEERSEIRQLKQQEAMYRANDAIIKSDLRPKLDFNASYGYMAGQSSDLFKVPYDTWRVGITLRVPLFDGFRTSGRRSQNAAQLEQVREARIDRERSVAVERSTSRRELTRAVALRDAAREAYAAGFEALRVSRESFDQGLITSLDLLTAERTERQLESQRRRAELGVWSALFDARRALGLPPL
jgi:outer membrane protein TolC